MSEDLDPDYPWDEIKRDCGKTQACPRCGIPIADLELCWYCWWVYQRAEEAAERSRGAARCGFRSSDLSRRVYKIWLEKQGADQAPAPTPAPPEPPSPPWPPDRRAGYAGFRSYRELCVVLGIEVKE